MSLNTTQECHKSGEVRGHVRQLVANILSVAPDEVDEAEFLSRYGVTSIELIDIAVKLEARYRVRFTPEAMKDLSCRSLSENVIALINRE